MSFYAELKRRNVIRVAAAYAVAAWLLIQVADTTFPLFGFDQAPARIVVILLVIGLVPALILAWAFELTPAGLQREEDVDRSLAITKSAAKQLDRIIIVVLVLALGFFAFDKFVLSESREQAIAESAREEGITAALESYKSNKSIAVLPFDDLSENQDQAYFADGISEELLNELARLEGLNVTGRTSSFSFRGAGEDLKTIGEKLGVGSILGGSVRREGNKLRVTAHLVNAQSGFRVWSNSYDRKINDIFDIQEDIATRVAGALSILLDADGRNVLPGAGTDTLEAYDVFLEGRANLNSGHWDLAEAQFGRAVDLDPGYAEAWTWQATTVGLNSFGLPSDEARAAQERARDLAIKATEIDPTLAYPRYALSVYQWARGDWIGATELHEKYKALAPADIGAQLGFESVLKRTGRVREALKIQELTSLNDPLSAFAFQVVAERYIQAGQLEDALAALARSDEILPPPQQGTDLRRFFLAVTVGEPEGIKTALGNYALADHRAATVVQAILDNFDSPPADVLEVMREMYENDVNISAEGRMVIASMAAYYGDAQFALGVMSDELSVNMIRMNRLWYPFFSDMRSLPGFKVLAKNTGLVDYWQVYGWADTCRPLGEQDFQCE